MCGEETGLNRLEIRASFRLFDWRWSVRGERIDLALVRLLPPAGCHRNCHGPRCDYHDHSMAEGPTELSVNSSPGAHVTDRSERLQTTIPHWVRIERRVHLHFALDG